jgi:protein phosphatase
MNCFGMSDVGKIRKNNEDSFYIQVYDNDHVIGVVADGMGGHKGGKKASSIAVKVISEYVEALLPDMLSFTERKLKQALIKAVKSANKAIYDDAVNSTELSGMGTTAVVCYISGGKLYALNAGDSRLYIINDKITQVTKDHSFVGELVELGVISEQQAQHHPQKNIITRALGTEPEIDVDIYTEKLNDGDTILLCTDGLTNMLSDKKIIELVNSDSDISVVTKALIDEAKKSGGNDNITAVVIKTSDGGEDVK